MATRKNLGNRCAAVIGTAVLAAGCGSDAADSTGSGDAGAIQSGSTGGISSGNGGSNTNGGAVGVSAGGSVSGGGSGAATGGASAGGGTNTGGTLGNGGAANGGSTATGGGSGATGSGGAAAGGSSGTGGASANTGGSPGSGGAGTGGTGGASTGCKRGIAANTAPGAQFHPAITWWYNWSMQSSGANVGIEFVPMIWGAGSLNASIPAGSKFLLTFNEPNFKAQSNLTPQEAAADWPTIQAKANAAGIPIVGPAVNFCGPAASCNDGTSPYQYLKDFFAACSGCQVDYVAVHWYNCDLPSLKDYLEPGGNLEGFEQFGKPIWLTEFSCDGSASEAQQEAYMKEAVPYLEGNPHVFRYSWFSADPIPNAKLVNSDGSPTALGNVYIGLAQSCQP